MSSKVVNVSQQTLIWFSVTMSVFLIGTILTFSFMIATNVSNTIGRSGPSGPQGPQGTPGICNLTNPNLSSPIVVSDIQINNINMGSDPSGNISFQNGTHKIQGGLEDCLLLYSSNGICVDTPKIGPSHSHNISPLLYDPNDSATSLFFLSTQICFTPNCSIGIGPSANSSTLKLYGYVDTNLGITFPLYVNTEGIIDGVSNQLKLSSTSQGIKLDTNGYGINSNDLIFNDPIFAFNDSWIMNGAGIHLSSISPILPYNNISSLSNLSSKVLSLFYLADSLTYQTSKLKHEYDIMNYFIPTKSFPNNISMIESSLVSVVLKTKNSLFLSGEKSILLLTNDTFSIGARYIEILNNSFIKSDIGFMGSLRKITFTNIGVENALLNLSGPPYSTSFASIEANDNDLFCPLTLKPSICSQNINVSSQLIINLAKFIYNATGSSLNGPAVVVQTSNGNPIQLVANSGYFQNLTTNIFNVLGYTNFPSGMSANGFILTGGGTISGITTANNLIVSTQFNSGGITTISGSSTTITTTNTNIQSKITFGVGTTANCSSPIFFTSASSAFPCLPDCLDFYTCTLLNAIRIKARNTLLVGIDENQLSPAFSSQENNVTFGTQLNYVTRNTSTLSNVTIRSNAYTLYIGLNGTKEKHLGTKDTRSFQSHSINYLKKKTNGGVFGELTSMTALPSSSCLPNIVLTKTDLSSFTFPPPYFNYSASTCTQVVETYEISNMSITKDGNMFLASATLKRICSASGGGAFCSPFFEWFVDEIFLKELLMSNYSGLTKQIINPNGPLAFTFEDVLLIRNQYINLTGGMSFQNSSLQNLLYALFNQNFSMPNIPGNTEHYEITTYSYIALNGTTGTTFVSSSSNIDFNEGRVIIENNDDIKIKGNILDSNGATHPCCGGSTSSGSNPGNFTEIRISTTTATSGATASPINYFEESVITLPFTTLVTGSFNVTITRMNNLLMISTPPLTITTTFAGTLMGGGPLPVRFRPPSITTNDACVTTALLYNSGLSTFISSPALINSFGYLIWPCAYNGTAFNTCSAASIIDIFPTTWVCRTSYN